MGAWKTGPLETSSGARRIRRRRYSARSGEFAGPIVGACRQLEAGLSPARGALLTRVRQMLRIRRYSRRTEEGYIGWIRRLIRFCGMRQPAGLGETEVLEQPLLLRKDIDFEAHQITVRGGTGKAAGAGQLRWSCRPHRVRS